MTEKMHYATYGRSRHRRRDRPSPRRRREEEAHNRAGDRGGSAVDPPDTADAKAIDPPDENGRDRMTATSSAAAAADGPEGCYYIPPRVRGCGMETPPRDASKSPVRGRGDPPARSDGGVNFEQRQRQRHGTKFDASTPSLASLPKAETNSPTPRSSRSPAPRVGSRRSPTPPRSRSRDDEVTLSRSRSWDGRTRHYDRNKLKSFDSSHSESFERRDGGYVSGGDTVASRLSQQLAGFDLNPRFRGAAAVASSGRRSGIIVGRKKAVKKKRGKGEKSTAASSSPLETIMARKDEAKSFLRTRVAPLVPVMSAGACKKRFGGGKHLEGANPAAAKKKRKGLLRGISGEDGSATCNSSFYDSSDRSGDQDDDDNYSEDGYSDDEESYYSDDESDDASEAVSVSSGDDGKETEGGRRSSFLKAALEYDGEYISGGEDCPEDEHWSEEEGEGNYHSSDDDGGSEERSACSRGVDIDRSANSGRGRSRRRRSIGRGGEEGASDGDSYTSHNTRGSLKSRSVNSQRSRSNSGKARERQSENEAGDNISRSSGKESVRPGAVAKKVFKKSEGQKRLVGLLNSVRGRARRIANKADEAAGDADSYASHSTLGSLKSTSSNSRRSMSSNSKARQKSPDSVNDESDDDVSHSSGKASVRPNAVANREGSNRSKSQTQLAGLLNENEALRANVVALRSDFETLLRHLHAVEDASVDGGASISSDEDSHVSHCLRRVEDAKALALGKIEEEERRRRAEQEKRNSGHGDAEAQSADQVVEGDKDLQSLEICIDELLSENEHLCSEVAALSKEREEILREVHALRGSGSNTTDLEGGALPDNAADPAGAGIDRHPLLTDEEVAKSHSQTMEDIASLICGISALSKKDEGGRDESKKKEDVNAMGDEIMLLVSKILSQRVPRAAPAAAQEGKTYGDDEGVDVKGNHAAEEGAAPSANTKGDSDSQNLVSDRRRSEQSNRDGESISVRTVTSSDGCDDENGYINKEVDVSSNSLFDGTSPSIVDSFEIIYEYETASEEGSAGGSSCTSQRSAYDAYVGRYKDYHHDDGSCSDETYGTGEEGEEYYPDENIEYPPRGYHGFSPSPSRRSSRSSSTARPRNSSNSEDKGDRHYRRGTSFHSHCSSYAASRKSNRGSGVEKGASRSVQGSNYSRMASEESHDNKKPHMDDNLEAEQEELANVIEGHLVGSPLLAKSPTRRASSEDTSSSEDMAHPSSSSSGTGSSTRECKGIAITVVSRASFRFDFPSSPAQTYVRFFNSALTKSQVDAVLEEQFQETRETLDTHHRTNCSTARTGRGPKKKKYQGEHNEDGLRHGYGIYTSKNGNEYRGEWQHDQREGLGVVKVGNGDVFEGQFERNLKNGIGVYHYKDGECDLSRYKNDARIGDSIRYSKDRTKAFLLSDRESAGVSEIISLEEAAEIAMGMGTIVAS